MSMMCTHTYVYFSWWEDALKAWEGEEHKWPTFLGKHLFIMSKNDSRYLVSLNCIAIFLKVITIQNNSYGLQYVSWYSYFHMYSNTFVCWLLKTKEAEALPKHGGGSLSALKKRCAAKYRRIKFIWNGIYKRTPKNEGSIGTRLSHYK